MDVSTEAPPCCFSGGWFSCPWVGPWPSLLSSSSPDGAEVWNNVCTFRNTKQKASLIHGKEGKDGLVIAGRQPYGALWGHTRSWIQSSHGASY
jgi:hypothetical protein